MKKTILCIILSLMAILFISCSDGESSGGRNSKSSGGDKQLEQIAELSAEAVKVKVHEVNKRNDTYGYAEVTITMPDYTELFEDAFKKSDPVGAVAKALKSKDYDKTEFDTTVPVTFDEKGKETVHSEDEIRKLLEAELIKALNAVYEEEER